MKKLVVLSGAGMSAESGLRTFRDSDGLWEQHRIEDVATPQAWIRNRALVLEFYNQRRIQVMAAQPNPAHLALVKLESKYDVRIITQNIDDLHERAGSMNVLHLHGEIRKSRSTVDPLLVYQMKTELLNEGDRCEKGSQLRPHIVWFGEMVPELPNAVDIVAQADILIVIGTSLAVYPAASLVGYSGIDCKNYYIDPNANPMHGFQIIRNKAGIAVPELVSELLTQED